MHPTREDVEDGEKILGEFMFGAKVRFIENHDFSTVLLDQELDALESESCETVFVGNHNPELVALQKSSQ
jgi:hypothetical protein